MTLVTSSDFGLWESNQKSTGLPFNESRPAFRYEGTFSFFHVTISKLQVLYTPLFQKLNF
jgi:hypothetical protein